MTPTEALIAYLEARGLTQSRKYYSVRRCTRWCRRSWNVRSACCWMPVCTNGMGRAEPTATAIVTASGTPASGPIPLRIPRLRKGSYYPRFLDDQAEIELLQLACRMRLSLGH